MALASAIYEGWVRHRRYSPRLNAFRYKVFMMYLDLAELEQVFKLSPLWGRGRFCLARFKRSDFHGDPNIDLTEAVKQTVFEQTGKRVAGPIRMLANLKYWGYNVNPICTYYCFNKDGTEPEFLVAEVKNTPWGERHAYVLECADGKVKQDFAKKFHVSPFNPLAMIYRWRSNQPGQNLALHIENWEQGSKVMDASLVLKRKEIDSLSLSTAVVRYPFMTVKVVGAIYWQALRLWLKKVPYVNHPKNKVAPASLAVEIVETK